MDFVPLAFLGALVYKFVDFLKFISGKDWNATKTQATAWIAGILGVILFAHSDFASSIDLGGYTLNTLNFVSQILIGLSATSLFSAFYDLKKSVDNTDSARTPALTSSKSSGATLVK